MPTPDRRPQAIQDAHKVIAAMSDENLKGFMEACVKHQRGTGSFYDAKTEKRCLIGWLIGEKLDSRSAWLYVDEFGVRAVIDLNDNAGKVDNDRWITQPKVDRLFLGLARQVAHERGLEGPK